MQGRGGPPKRCDPPFWTCFRDGPKFIWLGAMDVTRPYKFIGFIHRFIGEGEMRIENLELSPGHPKGAKTGPPPDLPTRG